MIDQAVIDRGEAARHLMDNEAFISVINRLVQEHLAAVMATPPGPAGVEARERHHMLHYAVLEIVQEVRHDIALADDMQRLHDSLNGVGDEEDI